MVAGRIDRGTAVPKYMQLAALLRQRIISGEFAVNKRLPSQKQLAATYKVSVSVVRQALGMLQGEGLVKTYKGSGSDAVTPP